MPVYQRIEDIQQIDFFLGIEEKRERIIDLSHLRFIRPVGIVALLTTLERFGDPSSGPQIELLLPNGPTVRRYLARAGVYEVMKEQGWVREDQDDWQEIVGPGVRLMVPCTRFRDESDVERLAAQMETLFHTEFRGYGSLLGALETIFGELATNVVYHADSEGGYVLAQQYNYQTGPIVEVAVADCGIGIRESLRKNPDNLSVGSDADFIESATREGVSSIRDSYRGYGFHHVTFDLQKDERREMTIRSGTGRITIQGNGTVRKADGGMRYSGTIVSVTVPCEET